MFLLFLIGGLLFLTYLLLNVPQIPDTPPSPALSQEFSVPQNTLSKPIPVLYGSAWVAGNFLGYNDSIDKIPTRVCQG